MYTLYPPYIEGKLPAQQGDTLHIPFSFNRAGGFTTNSKINLKIRTVSTDSNPLGKEQVLSTAYIESTNIASFVLPESNPLTVGMYYKVQMQLQEGEGVYSVYSAYSTVGVFKYTEGGTAEITGLNSQTINNTNAYNIFYGQYTVSENDKTESETYYKFTLYEQDKIIEDTDWIIHGSSTEQYSPTVEFNKDSMYGLVYSIKTMNNLVVSSPYYVLANRAEIPLVLPEGFEAKIQNQYDYGQIEVSARFTKLQDLSGRFILYRKENDLPWEAIGTFLIDKTYYPGEPIFAIEDSNITQGNQYFYALAQTDASTGLTTERKVLGSAVADFEDMYLWDADRKLCLKYNPKVSSFKTTILESKQDTIGSQYPYFFRNGQVGYKDFPISALLSLQLEADKEQRKETPSVGANIMCSSTDLTAANFAREREYKLEILEWLNNGKPKVFTSPAEGRYLVRLLNVSLAPNEQLGRMIHTFNANAYEVGAATYQNLKEQSLVDLDQEDVERLHVNSKKSGVFEIAQGAVQARVLDAEPGTQLKLTFKNQPQEVSVVVGTTGVYNIFIADDPLVKVETDKEILLEYITKGQTDYHLTAEDGTIITKIVTTEKVDQYFGYKQDKGIIELSNLDNILYLRIQALDMESYHTMPASGPSNPATVYVVHNVDGDRDDIWYHGEQASGIGMLEYQYTIGEGKPIDLTLSQRIEYTAKDFGGKFKPSQILLSNGLYADIYYSAIEYNPKEEEAQ